MAGGRRFSKKRMADVILYVLSILARPVEEIKLRCLLYLIDTFAYAQLGKSITGDTYIAGLHGPEAAHFDSVMEGLVKTGVPFDFRKGNPKNTELNASFIISPNSWRRSVQGLL